LQTGITVAVLNGANDPANQPGPSNGQEVGEDAETLQTQGTYEPSGPIAYEHYAPDGEPVTHGEPAELSTNPLAAPNAPQPADRGHDNPSARGMAPGTGRGAGRNQNGTRTR
jgi:hypothetical protein